MEKLSVLSFSITTYLELELKLETFGLVRTAKGGARNLIRRGLELKNNHHIKVYYIK